MTGVMLPLPTLLDTLGASLAVVVSLTSGNSIRQNAFPILQISLHLLTTYEVPSLSVGCLVLRPPVGAVQMR